MTRSTRLSLLAILLLEVSLLTIGIARDYRLKHEDNNALHATFARSHLRLGLQATKGQNYFFSPETASGGFYAHHPPGPGLALAAVYLATGRDGPLVTRATAVACHLLATLLFFGLARRVLERRREALLATLLFVILPESAFFGRMLNHEVLVLPAAILLVRACWESLHAAGRALRWRIAAAAACVWAALAGWAGFFAIAACALYLGWHVVVRRNAHGAVTLAWLIVPGVLLFAGNLAHLAWVQEGGAGYLRDLLASRMGLAGDYDAAWKLGRILELHWRYFTLTGMLAAGALAYRGLRGLRPSAPREPAVEVGCIFLLAGAGYVAVFNRNAALHDYWQFLLLPASAIALTLAGRWLSAGGGQPARRTRRRALLAAAVVEIVATVGITLAQRHLTAESYCLETVERLRRFWL